MSEHTPITGELRDLILRSPHEQFDCYPPVVRVSMDERKMLTLCDAIDAVHAGLERENAELRERMAVLDNADGNMHETDAWKLGYDEGFASADDWLGQHEDAMEEHGWVRLPLDADGVPWRIGDVNENGRVITGMSLNMHGWSFTNIENDIDPSIHRHHRPDSWERIIEDAIGDVTQDPATLVARCRALAGEVDA